MYRGSGRVYCEAFVTGQAEKLKEEEAEKAEVAGQQGGNALVVIGRRLALVERKRELANKWLREVEGIKLYSTSGSNASNHDAEAWEQGKRDGRECNLEVNRTLKITHQK